MVVFHVSTFILQLHKVSVVLTCWSMPARCPVGGGRMERSGAMPRGGTVDYRKNQIRKAAGGRCAAYCGTEP